jgi:hypothetical protein
VGERCLSMKEDLTVSGSNKKNLKIRDVQ